MAARTRLNQLARALAILLAPPVVVAAISFLRWNLTEVLGAKSPYTLYIFGIILTAQVLGLTAGLLTTLLSAVAGAILFLPAPDVFLAFDESEITRFCLFVAEGLAISISAELLRSARSRSKRGETDLRVITDHIPAVIAYVDKNETYRFANRGFLKTFNVKPSEVIGKNSREFLADDSYKEVHEHIARALRGEPVEYETKLNLKHRDPIEGRVYYIPDFDEHQEPRGYFAMVVDVTESNRQKRELEASQNAFKTVLEHAPIVYLSLAADGTFTRLDGHGLKGVELDSLALKGKSYNEVFKDHPDVVRNMGRALRGETFTSETSYRGRVFFTHYVPNFNAEGELMGAFGIATDITALKVEQNEKLRIGTRLQLAVQSGQLGAWELDIAAQELTWDEKLCEIFGVPWPKRLKREELFQMIHPEDRARVTAATQQALTASRDGSITIEYRLYRPSTGELVWVMSQGKVFYNDAGQPIQMIGIAIDITDQKRAELELRQSQERLELALESARMGSWFWDIDTGLMKVSPRSSEIAGVKDLGSDFFAAIDRLIHRDDVEGVKEKLAQALATDGRYKAEFRIVRPDGSIGWILSRAIATFDRDHRPLSMTGLLLDVTDQRLFEQNLVRAKDEAERASNMKSAFLANMSHEIRTPLGAMLGFAGFLKDRSLSEEERVRYVDVLTRNGEQLMHLIDDILDFSKVAAGQVSFEVMQTKPAQIVEDVVALLEVKAREKGLQLTASFDDSMPDRIGTDPTRLKQILFNIIGNAVKFTNQGSIRVRVFGTESISGTDLVSFEIRDSGIGIPPESAEQLFQAFTQADESMTRKFGGTGLGLALSKRLAQGLGGDVSLAASRPGEGSTFLITIADQPVPAILTGARPRAERNAPENEQVLAGLRVLLVEDSEDNRFLVSRMITKRGGQIETAANGAEGVEKALAGGYDLVLMDIQMPVLDGHAATAVLREKGYQKPIIALTAHAMSEARAKTREAGCTDHLTKPIHPNDLVAMILRYAKNARPGATLPL